MLYRARRISNQSWCLALLLVATWFGLRTEPALAVPDNTPPSGVIDEAGIIDDSTEAALNGILRELWDKDLAQMRVLTIQSTEGRDLHDYAMELARKWRLGDAKNDNGVLMVIAHADRKYRVITGEGIEDELTDAYLGEIGRNYFVPNFKRGNYSLGIYEATTNIARRLAGKAGVPLSQSSYVPPATGGGRRNSGKASGLSCVVFLVIFVLAMSARRSRYGYRSGFGGRSSGMGGFVTGMLLSSLLNSGGRRGGGFGGGGFGGGGGGSFGGGGAGGSW